MERMRRLAFIGTYPDVSKIFEEQVQKRDGIQALTVDASFERAVEKAKELAPGLDAILSRGGTADFIRRAVDIPVVFIPITPFDVVVTVHRVLRDFPRTQKIGFIHYHKNILGLHEIEEMYGISMQEYLFSNYNDIVKNIQDACSNDIDIIIGGEVAKELAERRGIIGISISAGQEAVAHAIDETLNILAETQKERNKSAQLKAAFSSMTEGIVVTDEDKRIVVYNSAAEKIFKKPYAKGDTAGSDLIDANCQKFYETKGRSAVKNYIKKVGNTVYTIYHIPIIHDNKFLGVVSCYDDITKIQNLEQQIRREIHAKGFVAKHTFSDIIGESPEIKNTISMAQMIAATNSTILIEGESGTGKEYLAQSIHNASSRRGGPFVAVNCTAISETLLESELFGYESGAFTGAKKEGKPGLFELAHGGTLFLDEIGEITPAVQARLLRILQERELMRVGGNRIITVDVRVISATNKDLWHSVQDGSFRSDLYYRLNVFKVAVPPLRKRQGDVRLLSYTFAKKYGMTFDDAISKEILCRMERYDWPGNVRELQNVVERYCVLKNILKEPLFTYDTIDQILGIDRRTSQRRQESMDIPTTGTLKDIVEQFEYEVVNRVLRECKNDQNIAAERLGIGRTTLWRKLKLMDD